MAEVLKQFVFLFQIKHKNKNFNLILFNLKIFNFSSFLKIIYSFKF